MEGKLAPNVAIKDNRAPKNGYGTRSAKRSHGVAHKAWLSQALLSSLFSLFSVFFTKEQDTEGREETEALLLLLPASARARPVMGKRGKGRRGGAARRTAVGPHRRVAGGLPEPEGLKDWKP